MHYAVLDLVVLPLSKRLLANQLGVRLKYLTWIATELKEHSDSFYKKVRIPKGKGRFRTVYVVDGRLKFLHSRLKDLLEETVPATGTSYAYEPGCKISDTVTRMQSSKLLLSIDFKDHFGSVSMWQVTKMLEHHGANPDVAFLIARLCCITVGKKSFLPQGSVVSPLLSNRVCEHLLDPILDQAFPDATITRYSDNLYLGYASNEVSGRNTLSKLREVVRLATGWRCHKARIMPYYRRQRGLGLVLNETANMPKDKYQSLKALLYNLAHSDQEAQLTRAQESFGFVEVTVSELLLRIKCQLVYWKQFLTPSRHAKLLGLLNLSQEKHDCNNSNT